MKEKLCLVGQEGNCNSNIVLQLITTTNEKSKNLKLEVTGRIEHGTLEGAGKMVQIQKWGQRHLEASW